MEKKSGMRYYVFCDTPKSLQDTLNALRFYDIKEAFVIPGQEPLVCVIMEDPDESAREKLERWRKKTETYAGRALSATASFLESLSRRLGKSGEERKI